jgi:hypothetical protein
MPLRLLLAVTAIGALAVFLRRDRMLGCAILATLITGLLVSRALFVNAQRFAKPMQQSEAAEDTGLLTLLQWVPRENELVIASDLADPADNYKRNLRGFLLTAYGGHAFYVSNLRYWHYTRSDAVERLKAIRAFFGSPWSGWHGAWLAHTHITHVLVSDRCLPRWWVERDAPLHIVGRSGAWTLLEPHGLTVKGGSFPPSWEPMNPRYGRGPCL